MQPPEDVARDLAWQWLKKAASDLFVCEQLTRPEGAFSEAVAFHAQQAAEKSLKALLVWRQMEFPKTHDLERLLELAGEGDQALAESLRAAPSSPPTASCIAIRESIRRSPAKQPPRAWRSRGRSTRRWSSGCPRIFGCSDAAGAR